MFMMLWGCSTTVRSVTTVCQIASTAASESDLNDVLGAVDQTAAPNHNLSFVADPSRSRRRSYSCCYSGLASAT